eukprot:scaffold29851_cov157-Isochrysis_galbana.AAC.2
MGVLLERCFRGCAECRKILVQVPTPAPVGLRRASQGPGASLDSSGSGRVPGSFMSSRPVARRRKRHSGSSSGAGDGAGHEGLGAYAAVAALVRARCMAEITPTISPNPSPLTPPTPNPFGKVSWGLGRDASDTDTLPS